MIGNIGDIGNISMSDRIILDWLRGFRCGTHNESLVPIPMIVGNGVSFQYKCPKCDYGFKITISNWSLPGDLILDLIEWLPGDWAEDLIKDLFK